ncbi:PREDICTED: uncharacterized protein LOC104826267 isoform X2 [Tarenaya hassleriana]|uniref:uncharacterized protein LOC104826267 isoform X2 n=1 Tax=Tarenaya hassleriana TaxID=28532 RepID=UPI00053C9050|nr:PREDICTED: uncharacterized protein LOC104826267 isoform X2 [Tarenaya hassleriana]
MGLSRRKNAILREISKELENGLVEEENLERLEILEEILREEGTEIPESLKEAYRQVAMECTVRCLLYGVDMKRSLIEAIRRIWTKRVMALCDKSSSLVTRELRDDCRRLKLALTDEKVCDTLIEYRAKNKPLVSLKKLFSELHRETGASEHEESPDEAGEAEASGNRSSSSQDDGKGKEIVLVNALPELIPDYEQFIISNDGELVLVAEHSRPPIKPIPTPVFDRVFKDLKASKQDMVKALEKAKASGLNDVSKKENLVMAKANLSSHEDAPKPTLMARSSKAQTYEWEDSIDDSTEESNGDGGKANISKRKKMAMSPLRKDGASKGPRKMKIGWTTAETQAILRGYEIHGPQWKLIKEENPILAHRTNVNIKDKFRVEMRRQEACGRTARGQE